jgi:hypothetical protein
MHRKPSFKPRSTDLPREITSFSICTLSSFLFFSIIFYSLPFYSILFYSIQSSIKFHISLLILYSTSYDHEAEINFSDNVSKVQYTKELNKINEIGNNRKWFIVRSEWKQMHEFKGTQDWDFFRLRFWNWYYFLISYVKILRFYQKFFLIRPLLGEIRFFRLVWD